jgi:translation initiation factor 3 subunit L
MAQQRMALWAAEADIDEDVDLSLAIGNYGQNGHYDDGEPEVSFTIFPHNSFPLLARMQQPQIDEPALIAMQQHMAQQAAFATIPDAVKVVSWASDILRS